MAQRIHTESIRMLNYLSVKVSQILNKEGIQVSKDHDLKLKEILEISDSQFINKLQWGYFGSNRNNKQNVNPKVLGGIPS